LDQFLEFCIQECNLNSGVVRVGGRSKSENLNSFLLGSIKRTAKTSRQMEAGIYFRIKDQRMIVANIQRSIHIIDDLINRTNIGCIASFEKIKQLMKQEHLDQLSNRFEELKVFEDRTNDDYSLLEWLGLINTEALEYDFIQNFDNLELNNVKQGINSENDDEEHKSEVRI